MNWKDEPMHPTPDEVLVKGGNKGMTKYEQCLFSAISGQMSNTNLAAYGPKNVVDTAFAVADLVSELMEKRRA